MHHLQAARFLAELGNAGLENRLFPPPLFFVFCHRSRPVIAARAVRGVAAK
jgi:hypothetical protein